MVRITVAMSENGWEYTGYMNINCNHSVVKTGDKSLLIDDSINLEFDEEIEICKEYTEDI